MVFFKRLTTAHHPESHVIPLLPPALSFEPFLLLRKTSLLPFENTVIS
jgi:hypothetical protein